jgi:hypothetical protein
MGSYHQRSLDYTALLSLQEVDNAGATKELLAMFPVRRSEVKLDEPARSSGLRIRRMDAGPMAATA